MADSKITALASISTSTDPAVDPLVIVDISDTSMAASGTSKKVTLNNLLSSSPTATGNFTITGDLTVDTSTLKVDSTNNRVGIRTASPAEPLTIDNTSGVTTGAIRVFAGDQSQSRISIQNTNGQAYHLVAGNPGASNAGFALYDNTAAATRLYVDTSGNVTVSTGNVVMATSGKGIDFSATASGSGTMTSELLNDYEEGTWTPVLGGDGGTSGQTYSLQVGRYTKVGRQVICSFEATLTAVGTVTGNAIISGLPFSSVATSNNTDGGTTTIGFANNLATNQIFITGYLNGIGAYSFITGTAAAGTSIGNITATNIFGNTTRLSGTITYTAS